MDEISERAWIQQYEVLKRRIKEKRINGDPFSLSEVQTINDHVEALNGQLKVMAKDPLQYELVHSEIARRQTLMDNLRKLTAIIRSNAINTDASSMAVNPARPTAYISTNDGSTTNPLVTGDHKGKALLQRQEEVIKMQDEMLSEIESGVDRLHGQAKAMGEEITSQTAVIDNLDTKVDIATVALQEETRHAQEIKEKGKVCYLYICIAVEVVIIVLLLIVSFASPK